MKTIETIMLAAALTMAWGCSSDDDTPTSTNSEEEQQWTGSTFAASEKPTWAIDWSSNATKPDWQEPAATKYECSMDMLVSLGQELAPYSTDNDVMAVFIGLECRGVSYRNLLQDGRVAFLLHVKGSSYEIALPMQLRYYCDSLHHLNVTTAISPFTPNNVMGKTYQSVFNIDRGSTKYPLSTTLAVMLPEQLPFVESSDDMLAVFVGGECRGIGYQGGDLYEGWRVKVVSAQKDETAEIRYYSADKAGIYTILKTFTLSGSLQQENISF